MFRFYQVFDINAPGVTLFSWLTGEQVHNGYNADEGVQVDTYEENGGELMVGRRDLRDLTVIKEL